MKSLAIFYAKYIYVRILTWLSLCHLKQVCINSSNTFTSTIENIWCSSYLKIMAITVSSIEFMYLTFVLFYPASMFKKNTLAIHYYIWLSSRGRWNMSKFWDTSLRLVCMTTGHSIISLYVVTAWILSNLHALYLLACQRCLLFCV